MAAYIQQNTSNRAIVFVAAVLFHVLLAYFIASGLARQLIDTVAPPLVTDIVEEVKPEQKPPPPPPPELERPPVEVPPPDVNINIPVDTTNSTAITDVTDKPQPVAPPPPPPRKAVMVAPKLDVRRSPSTDDYYPPSARRAEIEGLSTIRTCVGPDGKTAGEPTVTKTSGNGALDEAAIKWAKRARFEPGTEDGKPTEMCMQFGVRFKLVE